MKILVNTASASTAAYELNNKRIILVDFHVMCLPYLFIMTSLCKSDNAFILINAKLCCPLENASWPTG